VTIQPAASTDPARSAPSATAATGKAPLPNWVTVPESVEIASGRWVTRCRVPAAMSANTEERPSRCGRGWRRSRARLATPSTAIAASTSTATRAGATVRTTAAMAGPTMPEML
jgi:hypothetical protein